MLNILVGLQIFIAIALILIILLQNGKGADIGSAFGGGGNNALLGPTDSANILTKLTWLLVFLFFVNTVAISVYQKYSFESEIEVFLQESEEEQSIPLEIENLPE
ncbi:preprotein translocase subunit SecG [Gammaproteobacteria bacterium]|jgi:preprotein translocase subunit SecG|nr:preprotein translocase subunit SecG [Gammaproteobacteria bacterium]|tara:strand:+ start:272 stop:586 length:315 start_codon:yes stop_codon:yes gene_type:complete